MSKPKASPEDKYKALVRKENVCVCSDEEKMMDMSYKDFSQKNENNNFICAYSWNIFVENKKRKIMRRHVGEHFLKK